MRTNADSVSLDLSDCSVDALEIGRAVAEGLDTWPLSRLCELAQGFGGELLEGLELDASPLFSQWLAAERRRLASLQAQVLSSGSP